MDTTAIIFLCFVFLCIGAAIGGLIERTLKRRSTPSQPLPASDNTNKFAKEGDHEVLSAWRTGSNKVWLDMDGKHLDNKDALQPEQRQRLLSLVLDLRPWLETARPAAPRPGVSAQPVQPEKNQGALADEEIKPAPALESIIEQIDKVLQVKLETSVFKDRGIRLTEGPGGIVIIKDGVNVYEGVDTVPDLEVKTLIQQAVADWEKGSK
jgi:hypothetical protein